MEFLESAARAGATMRHALRALTDSRKTLVWMTDGTGALTYLNRDVPVRLAGRPLRGVLVWKRCIHPDDQSRVDSVVQQAQQAREEFQVDYRVVSSDGGLRWVTTVAAPRFSECRAFLGYEGVVIDADSRSGWSAPSINSEATYRLLNEHGSDLISQHAPDSGIYVYASPSFRRVLGYEPNEMVGRLSVYEQMHPDDEAVVRGEILRQFETGGDSRLIEFRMRHKHGHYIWMGTNVKLLMDRVSGRKLGSVAVSRDVTVERTAQDELRKREERFRHLTTISSDWYWETDEQGRFTFLPDGMQRPSGRPAKDVVGLTRREVAVDPNHPELLECLEKMARLEPFRNVVYPSKGPTPGEVRYVNVSGAPVIENGVFKGYRGIGRDVTVEMNAARELSRLSDENRAIIENSMDILAVLDRGGRILRINRAVEDILGYRPEQVLGTHYSKCIHSPAELERVRNAFARLSRGKTTIRDFESRWLHSDGSVVHLSLSARWSDKEEVLYLTVRDLTERDEARRTIQDREQRLHEVIQMTPAGYVLADAGGRILDVNIALCRISGYQREELVGRPLEMIFSAFSWHGALAVQSGPSSAHGLEAVLMHKAGHQVPVLFNGRINRDGDGYAKFFTAFLTDITRRKQAESRMEHLAMHDTLTGLPNRAFLNVRVEQMIERMLPGQDLAVLFIDLDRFKEVNDSFGHEAGDALLREISRRLKGHVRPDDVIVRLGGDEFVVAAWCSGGRASATGIAEKLLSVLAAPVEVAGHDIYVTASIGISMYSEGGTSKQLLFQHADTAMYRAKAARRNAYRFFEPGMTIEVKTRMAIEGALRHALARGEFALHYQPRLDLKTMSITGMEALLRWRHPEFGHVGPAEFIPIAEQTGLIEEIGLWVVEEACTQAARWIRRFGKSLRISVNLSPMQLQGNAIVAGVQAVLAKTGLAPQLLELELTENALVQDMDRSAELLRELKALGVKLAVDDFGTGYSGLAYLRRFPLDVLKLDRSFVIQQDEGISNFAFIKAFVDMAHALRLSVVAEGVETGDILKFLRKTACDEAQGYCIERPLTLEAAERYLARLPHASPPASA